MVVFEQISLKVYKYVYNSVHKHDIKLHHELNVSKYEIELKFILDMVYFKYTMFIGRY